MNVYIAAPWISRAEMPAIAEKIEGYGHKITHRWWEIEDVPEADRTAKILKEQALKDVEGVVNADVVVLINSGKSEGKATESGIAIAAGKPIIAVGERGAFSKNVFHYLDNFYWTSTPEVAAMCINSISEDWYRGADGSSE